MLGVLRNPDFARLFAAQIVALLGTGLLTVALGLLAYELAGDAAGAVLGTAYVIKMVAYVGLAPVASAVVARLDRRAVLVAADLVRAGAAMSLFFIDAVWQIYVAIFLLQAASATFTPTFQAIIPDILRQEEDYTRGLSLSRMVYDIESLASPAIAAAVLLAFSFESLFVGTVAGFLISAGFVLRTCIPALGASPRSFGDRLTRGLRLYFATPRCRGFLALNLTAAAAGAFVIVNTVVVVQSGYAQTSEAVALVLALYGGGSMAVALALPSMLNHLADRTLMMRAAAALAVLTLAYAAALVATGGPPWPVYLGGMILAGGLYSAVLTPGGRILRRSASGPDRPAIFAAHFAASHAAWLITYSVAGYVGAAFGLAAAATGLGALAILGVALAQRTWPPGEETAVAHAHPDLAADDPHLVEHGGARTHAHPAIMDEVHRR